MKHTNDVEEGQNVNTLSEIEEYYKAGSQTADGSRGRQQRAAAQKYTA